LRPGGILVIQELFAIASGRPAGQLAALADLYFALTSRSGTLSVNELAAWQRDAGLKPRRSVGLRSRRRPAERGQAPLTGFRRVRERAAGEGRENRTRTGTECGFGRTGWCP
jgi:hypothetical protein